MSLEHQPFANIAELETLSSDLRRNVPDSERGVTAVAGALALLLSSRLRGPGAAILGLAGAALVARAWTGHCPWYRHLGLDRRHDSSGIESSLGIKVEQEIEVHRAPGILFAFWRNLEALPNVMRHVESVRRLSDRRSSWKVQGPLGQTLEWEAEITREIPDRLIAWQTLPGAEVRSAGSVRFEPTEAGGTLLRVSFEFEPPGGKIGAAIASLLGASPAEDLADDLGEFKRYAESALPVFAETPA